LLTILDNSTRVHGKAHPMIAVLSIGDCELLVLRRNLGIHAPLEAVFHTEMQRLEGNAQAPLQLARVDERIDAEFDENLAIEVIERGSAVHCISAHEGDIMVLGSDGVFDNLFLDEIVDICNTALRPNLWEPMRAHGAPTRAQMVPQTHAKLMQVARRIVEEAHAKCGGEKSAGSNMTPIGRGGKADDTAVVVGEVIEWTKAYSEMWAAIRRKHRNNFSACGNFAYSCSSIQRHCGECDCNGSDSDGEERVQNPSRQGLMSPTQKYRPSPLNVPLVGARLHSRVSRCRQLAGDEQVCSIT